MIVKLAQQDIKRYNRFIWKTVIGGFCIFLLLFMAVGLGLFGQLPSFHDLENPKSNQATEILSDDGKTPLGSYYLDMRSPVTYKELSPNLEHALIATEDNHFYEHSGIDFGRLFTIIAYNLVLKKQGGSTITQQLALNLYSHRERGPKRVIQKLQEWITAVRLERHYSKKEILTMYFNTVSFGDFKIYGIKMAAQTYFSTTPDKLTPDQAAVLVGMVNAPSLFSPIKHEQRSLQRRDFILGRMGAEGFLSEGQVAEYRAKPLGLKFHRIDHNEGLAPYFRQTVKDEIRKILKDNGIVKADGTSYDLDRDGLKIYTTLNADMQKYAEDAQATYMRNLQAQFNAQWKGVKLSKAINNYDLLIRQGMQRSDRYQYLKDQDKTDEEINEDFNTPTTLSLFTWHGKVDTVMKPIDSIIYNKLLLRNAMMSMDPVTGQIKAWVGGINFEHFKYDQVKRGARQVGSTAKPFTYAVAMENGDSPCRQVNNVPDTIYYDGKAWCPRSGRNETIPGMLTLRQALAHSQNWITAHLIKELGPVPVMELIKKAGVTTPVYPYPTICIGAFEASVFDMTGAYTIFANQGLWTQPTWLLRIEDKNGNVLYTQHTAVKQVLNPQTAYVMTYMLKGVIEEGTGTRLRWRYNLTNPIAGKTGTTNDNSDGWFIGVTPQLVTGVWTGCEDRDIHFNSTSLGEGANSALPIFALYMQKVYANPALGIKKNVDFVKPPNGDPIQTDCSVYNQQTQTGSQPATASPDKKLGF